ncbi:hypothetical protein KFE25_004346 [Diacronema lutheri]|uniref:Uncharacterized protein n=1 Tax=Diacronema lutheri TaxID=2081491 RepID=A0A8J6C8H0_DIALT|nr:hypothetical protein KFE25_004346 [Diacronema lutheri]
MADSERKALVRALREQSNALLAVQHMFDVRTAQSSVDLDRVRILQHIHATIRRGTPSLSRMPPMPVRASRQGGAQGAGADGCAGGAALSVSLTARCCRALALPIVSVARVAPRIARCSDVASAGGQAASPADAAPASASWTAELSKARAECAAVAALIAPARARASDEEASFDRFNASVREELGRALAPMSWQLSRPVSSTGGLAAQRSRRQHNVSMSSTRISSSAVGGSTTRLSSSAVGTCATPTASTSPSIPSSPTAWASTLPSRLLTPLGRSRLGGGSPALVDRRCPPDEHVATITPLSRGRADRKRCAVSTTS